MRAEKMPKCWAGRKAIAFLALAVFMLLPGFVVAQTPPILPTLGKGFQIFLQQGLQIQGMVTPYPVEFDQNLWAQSNFTSIQWQWNADHLDLMGSAPGMPWGEWVDFNHTAPTAYEAPYASNLLSLQVYDELDLSNLTNRQNLANWFAAARPNFPNTLLFTNQEGISDTPANIAAYMSESQPDMLMYDTYPISTSFPIVGGSLRWAYQDMAKFRALGLAGNDGTGQHPIPVGHWYQTFSDFHFWPRFPSESEIRCQQFAGWTFGEKLESAFVYDNASPGNNIYSGLFNGYGDSSPTPAFYQVAESNRQSLNLGPALVRLISTDVRFVPGQNASGTNVTPDGMSNWSAGAGGSAYMTAISATNPGTLNGGRKGDVLVGYFKPLDESFDGPDYNNETYVMVTNGLTDANGSAADCAQNIALSFNFGYSGVTSLQRLRRSDGTVEVVPLGRSSGSAYSTTFALDGGTGDLFKFNDGAPFVGVATSMSWDPSASNGANLGGNGTWDSASSRWYDDGSAANSPWGGINKDAVFTGAAGTVTLASGQVVNTLHFKTSNYTLAGSTLNIAGAFVTTDTNVTATISSTLNGTAGLTKAGAGTLVLTNAANTYTGGTAIVGGTLRISADSSLGPAPASFGQDIILNGGTLQFGASFDISNNRGIAIGPSGGAIDTQGFNNPSGYNATAGGFTGPGDLTKLGGGTFFAAATTGGANTTWKGRLIIKQGTWKIVASDGLPYNPPTADGLQAAQVTLDGGIWQIAATKSITNPLRGITVTSNGGTIDTMSNTLTWNGPLAGTDVNSVLHKIGAGTLRFNGTTFAGTYVGNINIDAGTLQLDSQALGSAESINLANTAGAALNITTADQIIGSLSGGGSSGGNVTLNGRTLTTGGNNRSTTFGGVISGTGSGLTKTGSGTMILTGASTYSGGTTVSAGMLVAANTSGSSATGSANVHVLSGATIAGTGTIAGTVVLDAGAHLAPGTSAAGILKVAGLSLASNDALDYELGGTGTGDLTVITSAGGLAMNGGGIVNITALSGFGTGEYPLLDYTSSFTGSPAGLTIGSAPAGFFYSFVDNPVNSSIDLVVAAPEPAVGIVGGIALLIGIAVRPRGNRRARRDNAMASSPGV